MRCPWARNDLAIRYHDEEWGRPVRDDRTLFEFLILEGAQAGLSWDTILAKREHYRLVYDHFDAAKVARYDARKAKALLADPGIVRNRLKVESSISNAQACLAIQSQHGSLANFLWQIIDPTAKDARTAKPIVNRWETITQVPASTPISDAMSKALKKAGFRFVGTTICYAFMQATGMVNDHLVSCPARQTIKV